MKQESYMQLLLNKLFYKTQQSLSKSQMRYTKPELQWNELVNKFWN